CPRTLRPPIPSPFPYTTLFRSRALRPSRRSPSTPRRSAATRACWRWAADGAGSTRRKIGAREVHLRVHPAQPFELAPVRDCELRSEEHTSELQSRENLVCRHLL